ncbi:MAG TPA: cell division protein ZapE, partial [Limnochordia bacterium]
FEPDPNEPTQARALARVESFVAAMWAERPWHRWRRGSQALYLDGGFGVGKSHLLAAAFHAAPQPKAFLSFAELTYAIGALGIETCLRAFAGHRLLCIDEFELDDVANTRLAATVLDRLLNRRGGVRVIATSNTLPDALGAGRFNAEDFRREIGRLGELFEVVTIAGPDYRRRRLDPSQTGLSLMSEAALERAYRSVCPAQGGRLRVRFPELLAHLAALHPSRYGRLVEPVGALFIEGVVPIEDQAMALRFVHWIDKVYEYARPVWLSGELRLDELFADSYRFGGYRKKYERCLSRLVELLLESGAAQPVAPS